MFWILLLCIATVVIMLMSAIALLIGFVKYIKDGLYKEDFYIFDRKGVN